MGFVSDAFSDDQENWVSPQNSHWNRLGHERIAKLVYGLVEEIHGAGLRDVADAKQLARYVRRLELASDVDFTRLAEDGVQHLNGGGRRRGVRVSYASVALANPRATSLRVRGQCLARPELDGARVDVWLDDERVGELVLRDGVELDERFDVPAELAEREYLSVRFVAEDFVYADASLHPCVVFRLVRLSLR